MGKRISESELIRAMRSPELQHGEALSRIAGVLSGRPHEAPQGQLNDLSRWIFGAANLDTNDQAQAVAELLTNRLGLIPEYEDHRALLIDHALERRQAHPILIAAIGHELARRAGLRSFVGSCARAPWLVIRGGDDMALVGSAHLPTTPKASAVCRCCPHEVAYSVLSCIRELAPGDVAQKAERLQRMLPVYGRCAS